MGAIRNKQASREGWGGVIINEMMRRESKWSCELVQEYVKV